MSWTSSERLIYVQFMSYVYGGSISFEQSFEKHAYQNMVNFFSLYFATGKRLLKANNEESRNVQRRCSCVFTANLEKMKKQETTQRY